MIIPFKKFRPDIFILRGHYSLANHDKPNCKILPVTLMEDIPEAPFTLVTAHNALKEVAAKAKGSDISLAVSVSVAGRWYRPLNYAQKNEWDYAPFKPCTKLPEGYGQYGNIGEVRRHTANIRDKNT
ncbi:hypothetical protein HPB48_019429 [Haemaphysalis longicornis]|uniref:Uncharacterized protein n=1 Tax=Haemaphysalis longicornis TaxID=44386 RepID=A0A9J6FNJ9_HAELO|nr:hypothetical protein HPB48_019429 [Haemaphysalis longicornis]